MTLPGIRFGPAITAAASAHGLDPALLAAVAAQETGGPGSDSGANIVGDGGHGRGLFQIDDRSWAFARGPGAMDPAKNADMAATILADNLHRYGGNVTQALSAYNAGAPDATGTMTTWGDGQTLGYADSVMRHYAAIESGDRAQAVADNRETAGNVNALAALGASRPAGPATASTPAGNGAALALAQQAMPQLPQPLAPPPPVPTGSQAQAASSVGAAADHDEADLVDQGDVYDDSPGDDS